MVFLGIALLVLTVYQFNQYLTTTAALNPSLAKLNELGADTASLATLGISASDLESTKGLLTATTSAMVMTIALDLVLGIVFLAGGIYLSPKKD